MTTSISFIDITHELKKEIIDEIKTGEFEGPDQVIKLFEQLCDHGWIERESYWYDELYPVLCDRAWKTIFIDGGGSVFVNYSALKKE